VDNRDIPILGIHSVKVRRLPRMNAELQPKRNIYHGGAETRRKPQKQELIVNVKNLNSKKHKEISEDAGWS
jgi:hypothetical protein